MLTLPSFDDMAERFGMAGLDELCYSPDGLATNAIDLDFDEPMVQLFVFAWYVDCHGVIFGSEYHQEEGFPQDLAVLHIAQECERSPEFISEVMNRLDDCEDERVATALDNFLTRLEAIVLGEFEKNGVSREELEKRVDEQEAKRESEINMMKEMFGE